MISYLRGQIRSKKIMPKKYGVIVMDVGGVGYRLYVLSRVVETLVIGRETEMNVYTQVAEGVLDLYGFGAIAELDFFELLIGISGIGPKSALDILEKAKIEDLRQAAQTNNHELLSKISGIGPKTAKKVVDGLKDKLGAISEVDKKWNNELNEAMEALTTLGYSVGQARTALSQCQSAETAEKIREALKILGRK